MNNNRSFGNTNNFAMNRGVGNSAFRGGNRVTNVNNLNRSNFNVNRTNLNVNRVNNVVGTTGNRGFGYNSGYGRGNANYHRSYGGYGGRGYGGGGYGGYGGRGYGGYGGGGYGGYGGRGYGGYGGLGYGGYGGRGYGGYGGLGYGGFGGYGGYGYGGYGLGGFGLGLLLGSSLGGYGYGGYGGGYGGYGGLGYGGYGGGYGGYGYGGGSGYYGPTNWLYGGTLYDYGYDSYANPYYSASSYVPAAVGVSYDYSQPINMVSAPPAESAADESATLFNSARDSFKNGDFAQALQQSDAALAKNPNDTSLHEFRALCLFALGRYDDAATPLYAVLSVGPGWDWATLINLYPNVSVYTSQLRALEEYVRSNAQSASPRFVLAYHYATEGHFDAAANSLKQVVALKPSDTLSAKLLEQIQAAQQKPTDAPAEVPPVPEPAAINTAVPEGATISGTWTTEPNAETKVSLAIQPGGAFQWKVNQKGQAREFAGTSNFGGGILTLVPDKTPPIVGRVIWTDANHMTFRVAGDSANASGLSFAKSVSP